MKRLLPLILFLCPLALHSQSSFLIPVQTTTGQGISGATVTLTCTDTVNGCVGKGPFSATSTNGNAAFTAIPAGNYTVAITGPNLTTFSYAYTVGTQPNGGTENPSSLNGTIYVDGATNTTIQSAVNAAALLNPVGNVIIPSRYAGTDTFANANGVGILDYRKQASSRFIEPLRSYHGYTSDRSIAAFPLGNDVPLFSEGPADVYVATSPLVGTTTTTINIGANASVPVSSFSINGGGSLVGNTSVLSTVGNLIIGACSGCSTEEYVGSGNWSVVDATHLSITAAKTHSGTTDIEQAGSAIIQGRRLVLNCNAIKPAQQTNAQCLITDPSLETILRTPNVSTDTWPLGGLGVGVDLTGIEGANSDFAIRNNNAASTFHFRRSDAAQDVFLATDSQLVLGTGIILTMRGATSGQVNLSVPSVAPGGTAVLPSAGQVQVNNVALIAGSANSNVFRVTADFTDTSSTSLQTITGLSWTLPANIAANYSVDCHLAYSQATNVADAFGIQAASLAPTNIFATGQAQTNATTAYAGGTLATLNTTTATNIFTFTPTSVSVQTADLHAMIENPSGVANTINIMVSQSTAADVIVIKRGSFCTVY